MVSSFQLDITDVFKDFFNIALGKKRDPAVGIDFQKHRFTGGNFLGDIGFITIEPTAFDHILITLPAIVGIEHNDLFASYRGGKEGLFGWFMGQVMRETRGKADPKASRELLQKALRGEG